jgi:RNA polymerase-binding transcription factor DksA
MSLQAEARRLGALIQQLSEELEALDAPSTTVSGSSIKIENRARLGKLIENCQKDLEEVWRARQRVREGQYGTCEACCSAIPSERLEALPETRICVGCATASEALAGRLIHISDRPSRPSSPDQVT